jgi:hypothetical protein
MSPDPLTSCLGAVLGSLLCSFFCLSWMLTANYWLSLSLTLRPTVSLPIYLGIKHPSGAYDQIVITVGQLRVCWCGVLSLTRGRVCHLQLLLALASAVILVSESLGTRDRILLCQIWDSPFLSLSLSLMLRPTVSRPVCLGIKHPSGAYDQIFCRMEYGIRRTASGWSIWGTLSDEGTGLSFTIASGSSQRSHSLVRAPLDSRPYFTVSDMRLPNSSPPTTRRVTVEVFDSASTRVVEIYPLKYSVCIWNRRHIFSRLYFPSKQFGSLRNA